MRGACSIGFRGDFEIITAHLLGLFWAAGIAFLNRIW